MLQALGITLNFVYRSVKLFLKVQVKNNQNIHCENPKSAKSCE